MKCNMQNLLLIKRVFFLIFAVIIYVVSCTESENTDNFTIILEQDWQIASDFEVESKGEEISKCGEFQNWISAEVPSTVLANLVRAGQYEDVFQGRNLASIDKERFMSPWWYRTEFDLPNYSQQEKVQLIFKGINYRADIWLNSKKIASADNIIGSFRNFSLDISDYVTSTNNALAIKVFPPRPGDFTIGFVDWNPRPPDENMGIWRPVQLKRTGSVSIKNIFVQTDVDLNTLKKAELRVSAELINLSDKSVECSVKGIIGKKRFTASYFLIPEEKKKIVFEPEEYDALQITNPHLWWPHTIGEPNLYNLDCKVEINGTVSDRETVRFGIREVSDFINSSGHRGYTINGKKILIRGGGWVDDLFLREDENKLRAQIKYVKHMNLNCIRLEGFWGSSSKLYDLADEYGILIMPGWSCQWEWSGYLGKEVDKFGGIITAEEMNLVTDYLHDQVMWLRNHPSVFVWVLGSDILPRPALEIKYYSLLSKIDPTRPTLASCGWLESEVSGPTGVKMNGPYDYVPPIYWYEDKENGGAYGFNTETGPGPQPPPLESFKKMIPKENLWPKNDMWNYHCSRHKFDNIERYYEALNKRYGNPENLAEFLFKAQMANYEAMRGMYESFAVNRPNTTGIIQWMLNSAWAGMYWQLYDWYLMPSGAFYGARTAFEPLNIVYNYKNRNVYIVNQKLDSFEDLVAEIKVLTHKSEVKLDRKLSVSAVANKSKKIFPLPDEIRNNELYFIDLRLKDKTGSLISNNFYWLSSDEDIMDYDNSLWFVTPIKKFADFTLLNSLPQAEVEISSEFKSTENKMNALVTLENTSDKLAFFIELKLVKEKSGECVLPVFWDDNYISLLPEEKRVIKARFDKETLEGQKPLIKINGWNIK